MIRAIGIDVVEVYRIEKAMANPRFIDKVLTPKEQEHCRTPQQVAGRWAVKEAMFKCDPSLKTFRQIEVLPGPGGQPVVIEPEGAWLVSISHEKGLAAAVAILLNGPSP